MSGVPSFFVGPAGFAAASLFALYRMSGVPSFFVGPAAVVAGFVVEAAVVGVFVVAVVAGLVVAVVVGLVLASFVFGGVVWAKVNPAKANNKLTIKRIFFINRVFSGERIEKYVVNLFK